MRKIIWILCLSNLAFAIDKPCPDFEKKSTTLISAQDKDIEKLKSQVKELENDLSMEKTAPPFYVWLGAGVLAGGMGTLILTRK